MRCRIGNWKTGVAVQLDVEAYEDFRRQTTVAARSLGVRLLHDRRLELFPARCDTGWSIFGGKEEVRHRPIGFHAEASARLDRSLASDIELPLFELHEMRIDCDPAYGTLITDPLEASHLLPWPARQLRSQRLSAEELRRQCYLRCRSHMLAGGHGYFDEVGIPVEVVRSMAGGYAAVLTKARAELDIAAARAA